VAATQRSEVSHGDCHDRHIQRADDPGHASCKIQVATRAGHGVKTDNFGRTPPQPGARAAPA